MWTLMSATAAALHEANGLPYHNWFSRRRSQPHRVGMTPEGALLLRYTTRDFLENPVFCEIPHFWVFAAV